MKSSITAALMAGFRKITTFEEEEKNTLFNEYHKAFSKVLPHPSLRAVR